MNTLYLRLPSSAGSRTVPADSSLSCAFALVSQQGVIARSGEARLPSLAATMAEADRVVLLLAASDVTLLSVKAPPLPPAKLKLALPGLIEEHILDDPQDCAIVTGDTIDGLLQVAVMRRERLQALADACLASGAKRLFASPIQFGLRQDEAALHLYGSETGGVTAELCLRTSTHDALGLTLHAHDEDSVAQSTLTTLRLLQPQGALTLHVPQASLASFQQYADTDITVEADNWQHWIAPETGRVNMLSALTLSQTRIDLRAWKLPLRLAAAVLLINTVALNADWWRLHREAGALKADMLQTYRNRFPDERVILDPLLQMQQKIAAGRRAAGEPTPDDFVALAAGLASASNGLPIAASDGAIASLDYRDRALSVKWKTQTQQDDRFDDFTQQLKNALGNRQLALQQGAADSWQIRRTP